MLLQNPGQGGSLHHLGIEVENVDEVDATQTRLAEHGLASVDERGTTCCYAKADKFWVQDEDGIPWEMYTLLADVEAETAADSQLRAFLGQEAASAAPAPGCCAPTATRSA